MRLAQVLEELAERLSHFQIEFAVVGGIATSARGEPRFTRDIDVAVAVSGDEQAERVATAEPLDVFENLDVSTATTEALLAMKVLSATEQRPRDLEDIRAMLQMSSRYDENRLLELLNLITKRGFHRQQDLLAKWTELKNRFLPSENR